MISLTKSGIVRVVETHAEAQRLMAAGYEATVIPNEEGYPQASLDDFTVPQLVKLCNEKGIEIPKDTKKKDEFIALILQYSEGELCEK